MAKGPRIAVCSLCGDPAGNREDSAPVVRTGRTLAERSAGRFSPERDERPARCWPSGAAFDKRRGPGQAPVSIRSLTPRGRHAMIFEDPSHRRWRRALPCSRCSSSRRSPRSGSRWPASSCPPHVPNPFSERPEVQATLVQASLEHDARPIVTPQEQKRMQAIRAQERKRRDKLVSGKTGGPMPLPPGAVVGFTHRTTRRRSRRSSATSPTSTSSCPDWFELPGPGCELDRAHRRQDAPRARSLPTSWCCRASRTSRATSGAAPRRRKFLADDNARAVPGEEARRSPRRARRRRREPRPRRAAARGLGAVPRADRRAARGAARASRCGSPSTCRSTIRRSTSSTSATSPTR